MSRYIFSEGVQERFAQSRFDAIHKLGAFSEMKVPRLVEQHSYGNHGSIGMIMKK